jgi:HNH endonuclease
MISLDAMPVPLSNSGLIGWVDAADWATICKREWRLSPRYRGQLQYVQARGIARISPFLHRVVADLMGLPSGAIIDHKDRNCLNNTRANLRAATHAQNLANSAQRNKYGYKGIGKTRYNRWSVQLLVNGVHYRPGNLDTAESAARVYDAWAKEAWGEFAWLNFPGGP